MFQRVETNCPLKKQQEQKWSPSEHILIKHFADDTFLFSLKQVFQQGGTRDVLICTAGRTIASEPKTGLKSQCLKSKITLKYREWRTHTLRSRCESLDQARTSSAWPQPYGEPSSLSPFCLYKRQTEADNTSQFVLSSVTFALSALLPAASVLLTVLARLFDLFQVGRLEHGADLLRGVNDDAAKGLEAVHQANVDPRQGNVSGFFLPL